MNIVELTRFKVKEGKSARVDEWLKFLNDNMDELEDGLPEEKMYVETIFRETLNGEEYLYWYSVQGQGGVEITENENWISKKHLEFWHECIDSSFGFVDLSTEVVMIPKDVKKSMV
jgi:hypothetical protein